MEHQLSGGFQAVTEGHQAFQEAARKAFRGALRHGTVRRVNVTRDGREDRRACRGGR